MSRRWQLHQWDSDCSVVWRDSPQNFEKASAKPEAPVPPVPLLAHREGPGGGTLSTPASDLDRDSVRPPCSSARRPPFPSRNPSACPLVLPRDCSYSPSRGPHSVAPSRRGDSSGRDQGRDREWLGLHQAGPAGLVLEVGPACGLKGRAYGAPSGV